MIPAGARLLSEGANSPAHSQVMSRKLSRHVEGRPALVLGCCWSMELEILHRVKACQGRSAVTSAGARWLLSDGTGHSAHRQGMSAASLVGEC